jgi:hypothetical protein
VVPPNAEIILDEDGARLTHPLRVIPDAIMEAVIPRFNLGAKRLKVNLTPLMKLPMPHRRVAFARQLLSHDIWGRWEWMD